MTQEPEHWAQNISHTTPVLSNVVYPVQLTDYCFSKSLFIAYPYAPVKFIQPSSEPPRHFAVHKRFMSPLDAVSLPLLFTSILFSDFSSLCLRLFISGSNYLIRSPCGQRANLTFASEAQPLLLLNYIQREHVARAPACWEFII